MVCAVCTPTFTTMICTTAEMRETLFIVKLTKNDLRKIGEGLMDSADNDSFVEVMIQADGLKMRDRRYGLWTVGYGSVREDVPATSHEPSGFDTSEMDYRRSLRY